MSPVSVGKSVFAIILVLLLLRPQPGLANQAPGMSVLTHLSPGDIGWKSGFKLNGTDKNVFAVAVDGRRVFIGGDFSIAGNAMANHIALWTGSEWTSLGQGVNDQVQALAVDGRGNLYAGGAFTQAGGQPASHIARWDGQQWKTLGSGVDGPVNAIAVDGSGNVYAGGIFHKAGDGFVNSVAKWDGVSWSALSGGIGIGTLKYAWVNALAIDRFGFVYAGGSFPADGGMTGNVIARWDGL
jgi:hypothetical protein